MALAPEGLGVMLRLIARLDIKGPHLIKPVQLEGVRKVGDPREFARRYYEQGADEILYMDFVASLYERDVLYDIVRRTAEEVFIPITVGGGLRSLDEVRAMLRAGADKVAINSAATLRPDFVTELSRTFGSQCVVLQIDAKSDGRGGWEAYRDGGREHTGFDAVAWARRGQELGAGEILLTAIDREGTRKGFDLSLTQKIAAAVTIPVIVSGGMGSFDHLAEAVDRAGVDAVAMAHMLHYGQTTVGAIRAQALARGFRVREIA
ncbi:MAG: imidazole glycerol phosphate synthase cyclase subunit [Magnetospirillum sp. WYHS-4]